MGKTYRTRDTELSPLDSSHRVLPLGDNVVDIPTAALFGGFLAGIILSGICFLVILSGSLSMFDISVGEFFTVLRRKPYYKAEYFIDEDNRKLASEVFPITGQATLKSKRYKDKEFLVPKSYQPDVIGSQRRIKYIVENAFPLVTQNQFIPADSYEVLSEVEYSKPDLSSLDLDAKDPFESLTYLKEKKYKTLRSDFLRLFCENKITSQIMAEPVDKWAAMVPVLIIGIVVAGILIFFGVVWPNMNL